MTSSNAASAPQNAMPQVKVNYNLKNDTLFDAFFIYDRKGKIESYPRNWFEVNKTASESLIRLIYPLEETQTQTSPYDFFRNFHVFSINGEDILTYGVTIELVGSILKFLLNLFKSSVDLSTYQSLTFTFITKAPYTNTLFRLLEILTQIAAGSLSLPHKDMYTQPNDTNLSPPVFNFLDRIYHMDLDQFIAFSKQNNFNVHHMLNGTINNLGHRTFMFCASSFGHPGLDILFSILSPKDIVTVYSAVLLEDHIIVYGNDMFLVSNVIMSFLFLISPLKPCVQFVPILPDTERSRDMFQSPTPYIFGFSGPLTYLDEGITLINLNKGEVIRSETILIPNAAKVEQDLQTLIEEEGTIVPKVKDPKDKKAFWDEMREDIDICDYEIALDLKYCFKTLIIPKITKMLHEAVDFVFSVKKLRACFESSKQVTKNGQTVVQHKFNKELFRQLYTTEESPDFAREISDTQGFTDYCFQMEDDINKSNQ